jgi:hypothetical protein
MDTMARMEAPPEEGELRVDHMAYAVSFAWELYAERELHRNDR